MGDANVQPLKQHFTFEMYAPTSVSESGVPLVERVSVQMQGEDLILTDILAKFEDFLRSCGYSTILESKRIDMIEKDN